MKKITYILAILLIILGIIGLLVSVWFGAFIILGIIILILNKKENTKINIKPVERNKKTYLISNEHTIYKQNENVAQKYLEYIRDDLEPNEEYSYSNKQVLEDCDLDMKIFKYEPYETDDFKIEENKIYIKIENEYSLYGEINNNVLEKIEDADKCNLIFYEGSFKYIEDDEVFKSNYKPYFKLQTIKKVVQ